MPPLPIMDDFLRPMRRCDWPVEANRSAIPGPGIHLPAPELEGGIEWFNTSKPIHLSNLCGKFVLLDFWTYCCINCLHLPPELKKLEKAYSNNVVVIGVHSGKFDTEHNSESIRQAIERCGIEHPVVNDANYKIWKRYGCTAWPSLRGIDPDGNVVAFHAGEIDFPRSIYFSRRIFRNIVRWVVLVSGRIIFSRKRKSPRRRCCGIPAKYWPIQSATDYSFPKRPQPHCCDINGWESAFENRCRKHRKNGW